MAKLNLINLGSDDFTEMLEAGVHYGHKRQNRNPRMDEYIYGTYDGISIINLKKTFVQFNEVLQEMQKVIMSNKKILFVCTMKPHSEGVKKMAEEYDQPYVTEKWPGGLLTNWKTTQESIKLMKKYREIIENKKGEYTKSELYKIERKLIKAERKLSGCENLSIHELGMVFVFSAIYNDKAIAESIRLGIHVSGIVDTDGDPRGVQLIAGNDDSLRANRFFTANICKALAMCSKKEIILDQEQEQGESI